MPNLTRAEAADRRALLRVDTYYIALDLTLAATSDEFTSETRIRFACAEPGATTFVQLEAGSAASIEEARLNGTVLDPSTSFADGRLTLRDLAADNELHVRARLPYSNAGEGLHKFSDPQDGETYLYAMAGPANAARVFACFDQPDLKAPIELIVDADPDWTVWANGQAVPAEQADRPGRFAFAPTQPISTFLMTVVAGPYYARYDSHDGVPLGLLARRSLASVLDANAEDILEVTRAALDWYHHTFGIRYPFGDYFQAFVPEFNWGAVENPGCVNFREELLFRGAVTDAERESRAVTIAHEAAHMWFGDLVTLTWWEDIWLNEAFAEYLGWRVAAEATRFTEAWTSFAVSRKAWGYSADQRPSTHPIAPDSVRDAAHALQNFDGISYAKGASVLRQLAAWLGDDAFLTGLRAYLGAHAFGNARLADLIRALADASGRDVTAWADAWLRTAQVNTLRPEVGVGADGRIESLAVVQSAPPERDRPPTRVLRPHQIRVAVYDEEGKPAFETGVEVSGSRTEVAGPTGVRAGAVLLNAGDLTYAKVRFDERSRRLLPDLLPRLGDSLAQAVAWSAAADATRDAEWAAQDYLALVLAALRSQHDRVFGSVLAFCTGTVVDQFLPPAARAGALASVHDLCVLELSSAPAGSSRQLQAARGVISTTAGDGVDRLRRWLAGHDVPSRLTIDSELRWSLVHRLAVLGAVDGDTIAAEASRDSTARAAEHASRARAALPDAAAKQAAWEIIVSGNALSAKLVEAAADGFWQPSQLELTAAYVERYFAEIAGMPADRGQTAAAAIARAAYPRYAIEPSTLELADRLLARADLDDNLRRVLVDQTDDLRIALSARQVAAAR